MTNNLGLEASPNCLSGTSPSDNSPQNKDVETPKQDYRQRKKDGGPIYPEIETLQNTPTPLHPHQVVRNHESLIEANEVAGGSALDAFTTANKNDRTDEENHFDFSAVTESSGGNITSSSSHLFGQTASSSTSPPIPAGANAVRAVSRGVPSETAHYAGPATTGSSISSAATALSRTSSSTTTSPPTNVTQLYVTDWSKSSGAEKSTFTVYFTSTTVYERKYSLIFGNHRTAFLIPHTTKIEPNYCLSAEVPLLASALAHPANTEEKNQVPVYLVTSDVSGSTDISSTYICNFTYEDGYLGDIYRTDISGQSLASVGDASPETNLEQDTDDFLANQQAMASFSTKQQPTSMGFGDIGLAPGEENALSMSTFDSTGTQSSASSSPYLYRYPNPRSLPNPIHAAAAAAAAAPPPPTQSAGSPYGYSGYSGMNDPLSHQLMESSSPSASQYGKMYEQPPHYWFSGSTPYGPYLSRTRSGPLHVAGSNSGTGFSGRFQEQYSGSVSSPPLVRTSALSQTVNSLGSGSTFYSSQAGAGPGGQLGGRPGNYGMMMSSPERKQMRASLEIIGNMDDLVHNWNSEEWESRRRLVQFRRYQRGAQITVQFMPLEQAKYTPETPCISCIHWAERGECYVTSVDCIYLLEQLVSSKFSVEEKNRIRRNLEGYHPSTVSKGKPDSGDFFRLIMSFKAPRPRNIEKDVKVFPWRVLSQALRKIISKYSADYSHNTNMG